MAIGAIISKVLPALKGKKGVGEIFKTLLKSGKKTESKGLGLPGLPGPSEFKLTRDRGFFGHSKVKGTKQDSSKWAKL